MGAMKAMKVMKAKGKGKGRAMKARGKGKVTRMKAVAQDPEKPNTDNVEVVPKKPKAASRRRQIMDRLKKCSVEEVLREAEDKVAECESTFKSTEDEFKSLQKAVDAAKVEQDQALQRAKAARDAFDAASMKQMELQKKMAVLRKAENDVASEIKMLERQRSRLDEIKEVKRLAQEAKDAVKAAQLHKKELALKLKDDKKRARVEVRVEDFECNHRQKLIEHVAKARELEHKKLEAKERALAKKESELVNEQRKTTDALPGSSVGKQRKVESSVASSSKQLLAFDGRMMPSPMGTTIVDSISTAATATVRQESFVSNQEAVVDNDSERLGERQCQTQSLTLRPSDSSDVLGLSV